MRTRHTKKLVSGGLLALIALACVWFFFAPGTLGGSTSYVVTDGISMEPRFHSGDLALMRSQSHYDIGQIVAYHSDAFHTIVLHRIVGRAGDRYIFKGDNNNFLDFEHPAASQLIGSLWLHIPGAGARLHSFRSPLLIAILVGVGTLLFAGAAFVRRTRRRRRQRRAEAARAPTLLRPRQLSASDASLVALGAVALLPLLALALAAFTRPATALLPYRAPYKQSGTFSYGAKASAGSIYPGDHAVTGDPLFTHVLSTVQVRFGYQFGTTSTHRLTGKARLDATIASSSGWKKTFALGSPQRFRGDRTALVATLDLPTLLALVAHVEATTAVGGSYTLTISPQLNVHGSVDALPLQATFSPQLKFALNKLEVQPIIAGGGSQSTAHSTATPFASSTAGSVTGRRRQSSSLALGPVRLTVRAARWIALGGAAILICALLALRGLLAGRSRGESQSIRARYGRLIVPVERVWHLPELAVIDVPDIEALVRIAEHYDRSILHEETEDGEAFWVTDESGQFRYAVSSTWTEDEEAYAQAYEQQATEWPVSDIYAEEHELMPEVSTYDALSGAASVAAYSTPEDQWAPPEDQLAGDDPTTVLPRDGWHTGYEAAETYAGSRTKDLR
jgi:signal peptidase I